MSNKIVSCAYSDYGFPLAQAHSEVADRKVGDEALLGGDADVGGSSHTKEDGVLHRTARQVLANDTCFEFIHGNTIFSLRKENIVLKLIGSEARE